MKVIDQNGYIPNQMASPNLPQRAAMHGDRRGKTTFFEKLVCESIGEPIIKPHAIDDTFEDKILQGKNNYSFGDANQHTSTIKFGQALSVLANSAVLNHSESSKDVYKVSVDFSTYATYKLSYINSKINFSPEHQRPFVSSTSNHMAKSSEGCDGGVIETKLSFDDEMLLGSCYSATILDPIKSEEAPNQERLAAVYQSTHYEKVKVSILGKEGKTLVVRDYGNQLNMDTGSSVFVKISEPFNKVIVNGKEV